MRMEIKNIEWVEEEKTTRWGHKCIDKQEYVIGYVQKYPKNIKEYNEIVKTFKPIKKKRRVDTIYLP